MMTPILISLFQLLIYLPISYLSSSSFKPPPLLLKPLNSFSAAHVCMDVHGSTGEYQTYIYEYILLMCPRKTSNI